MNEGFPSVRRTAAAGMRIFMSAVKDKVAAGYQHFHECFSALPLYHFLRGNSSPFGKLEMTPTSIRFRDELFELTSKTYDDYVG